MTRVDFYLLPDVEADAKLRFACRLAVKALSGGQRVHVHTTDEQAAKDLDELMWTYPNERFLPHARTTDDDADAAPVLIGYGEQGPDGDDVLINLSASIPAFFGRFERVAEVVIEPDRAAGRDRYRHYRDRGYPLFHHELEDWEDG